MVGGDGNDTFYKDSEDDIMVEGAGAGTDWVYSSINIHQLQDNIENIVIYGALTGANSFAVGNSVNNKIYVAQNNGDQNTLTLSGGLGNDSLYGNFSGNIFGYAEIPSAIADISDRDANDYLIGGDGNDYLYGAQGHDTMEGGLGNDTIVMTTSFDDAVIPGDYDRIWEFGYEGDPSNGGIDWVIYNGGMIDLKDVYTDPTFTPIIGTPTTQRDFVENGMFIENMQGSSATLSGNWLNNTILGGASSTNESLSGELGNDFLRGVEGAAGTGNVTFGGLDTLTGGALRDTFSLVGTDGNCLYLNGGSLDWFAVQNTGIQANRLDFSFALITDYTPGAGTPFDTPISVLNGNLAADGNLPEFDQDTDTIPHYESITQNYTNGSLTINNATHLYVVDGNRADLIAIY
jgi:hypothetical protein